MKKKTIKKPKWVLRILIVIVAFFFTGFKKKKINKINMDGVKWPYLIVASHASMIDFAWCSKMTGRHHANYICSIEEFIGRDGLMTGVGCFKKRKYTKDTEVVKNILRCIKNGNSATIYAEARYSICGINERIDSSIGKLAKMAGVPVVMLICHGDHLWSPHFNQAPTRKTKFEIDFKCIANADEVKSLSADEIQARIVDNFVFDDYQWQYDNKVKLKTKYRAHNIHRVLYKCPHCGKDYSMRSEYTKLWCKDCGATYEMDEYSRLSCTTGEAKFVHVPDWYKWERQMVTEEVNSGSYSFRDTVRIEHLESSKVGLKPLGDIEFIQDMDGIHLHGKLDNGEEFNLDKSPLETPSIHIEYNFKKKGTLKQGQAIDINTMNDTWFIYPKTEDCVLTKIHLATEALYDKALENRD